MAKKRLPKTKPQRAYDNAAHAMWLHLQAEGLPSPQERGDAANAAGFAAMATAHILRGEYEDYCTCMRLASRFFSKADELRKTRMYSNTYPPK